MLEITTEGDLEAALAADRAMIYKHSPICSLSFLARRELKGFGQRHPDIPVFLLDVMRRRRLSDRVEQLLEVRHQSPQVIALCAGRPVFDASHMAVAGKALADAVAGHPCLSNPDAR